jgi:hypothetical protein
LWAEARFWAISKSGVAVEWILMEDSPEAEMISVGVVARA